MFATLVGPWFQFDEKLPDFDIPLLAVFNTGNIAVISIGRQTFGGPRVSTIVDPVHAPKVIFAWCDLSELWGLIPPLGLSTQGKLDLVRDQAFRDWHATAKELTSMVLTDNIDLENLPIRPRAERLEEVQRFRAAQGLPPLEFDPKTQPKEPAPNYEGENIVPFKKL